MRELEEFLIEVEKPARYVGGEFNSIVKPEAEARIALCFPDVYEIGMSHLGLKILYSIINETQGLAAERCFAPWPDMAAKLREHGRRLASIETRRLLREFDVVGFSLQYELSYTNVLEMLDLAGIPIRASDRRDSDPIVLAGGPCAFNPEPMAQFIDAFLIGDGEEAAVEILRECASSRHEMRRRDQVLAKLAGLAGVYVPSQAETTHARFITPTGLHVPKRTLRKLDTYPFPANTVVPNIPATHDRVGIEIMRGCPQRCRFCQAGVIYRPTRYRDPASVIDTAVRALSRTGHDEIGLCSLSSGDYPYLEKVSEILMEHVGEQKTSLSLSSLRASALNENLSFQITKGKRTGFTIAPEAGTQRLRDAISKNITEEMIMNGCREAFGMGWSSLKLYFMIGLPTETEADVLEIAELARRITRAFPGKSVTVSVSSFVPKPHTPFQWAAQEPIESLRRKQDLLRESLRRVRGTRFKYHQVEMSFLEALISRGDRRIGAVIEAAWRAGQGFDGWTDRFNFSVWHDAIEKSGLDTAVFTGEIPTDEPLPWDHVEVTIPKAELIAEWVKTLTAATTLSCLDTPCKDCKACSTREGDYLRLKRVELPVHTTEPAAVQPVLREPVMYRAYYEKIGPAAYLSHLDMGHVLKAAMRRSGMRLAFTQGYSPLPKISYGPPLPVGMEGFREVFDFGLVEVAEPAEVLSRLNREMPDGMRFLRIHRIPGVRSHLSRDMVGAVYATHPAPVSPHLRPDAASDDRRSIRASHTDGSRLYLLAHPEARIDAAFGEACGIQRAKKDFVRVAVLLAGEDWRSVLPALAAAVAS